MPRKYSFPRRDLSQLAQRLTDRDFDLIGLLGRHRVLTIDQITDLLFPTTRSARERITVLADLDVVTRWRRSVRPGSQSFRHSLGYTGAYLYAAATGQPEPRQAVFQRQTADLIASSTLGHLLGVNAFFARLTRHARHEADAEVSEWLNETEASALTGGLVRPDGAGTFTGPAGTIAFWFEYDNGTETLHRLAGQVERYRTRLPGLDRALLIELTSTAREAHLHEALAEVRPHFAVATATTDRTEHPAAGVWRVLHRGGRWPLEQLTSRR
ncbi:replication-relaxation family protein [Glycomyces sp. MUSA5-2]|uniref:replication-relaxation family protein n=1 Tax=Glycomyces sp. MUSA5-2 TaxID=2053002 RepID=UPI00300A75ED